MKKQSKPKFEKWTVEKLLEWLPKEHSSMPAIQLYGEYVSYNLYMEALGMTGVHEALSKNNLLFYANYAWDNGYKTEG